jgi:hypothetical protein
MTEIEIVLLRMLLEKYMLKANSMHGASFALKLLCIMEGRQADELVHEPPHTAADEGDEGDENQILPLRTRPHN